MGCQKKIAKAICDHKANYLLALKGNSGLIYDEVVQYFKEAEEAGYEYLEHTSSVKMISKHGRITSRTLRAVEDIDWLPQAKDWIKLNRIIEIVAERTEKGKKTEERRYYITSMDADAEKLEKVICSQWAIENNLHRQLDVSFMGDDSPINAGNTAENLAIFRRLTLNILGSAKGLLEKRNKAAWDEGYLTSLVRKFTIKFF